MDEALRLEDLAPEDRTSLPYNHPLLDDYASRMAKQYGVDPSIVLAIKNAGERSGSSATSSANAKGVMQTIPSTQKALGITDPTDPVQSIAGGAKYLSQIATKIGSSDPGMLAAAYHAGPNSRTVKGNFDGSPITAAYVARVRDHVASLMPKAKTPPTAPAEPQLPDGLTIDDLTPEDKSQYMAAMRKSDPGMYDPTSGNSFGQNALIGAGKFFSDTSSGLRQISANALNPVSQALNGKDLIPQDYAGEQERKVLDDALMHTWGGNIGYGGAAAASLALPGGVASKFATKGAAPVANLLSNPAARAAAMRYLPIAATTAGLSTLTPTTAPGERGTNAAVSAALGPVFDKGGEMLGNAVRPAAQWVGDHVSLGPLLRKSFNATATPESKNVVAKAIMNDVPVYPQQLDKPGVELPGDMAANQLSKLTRAMNSTMGQESGDIPGAIGAARQALGDTYDSILGNKTIRLNVPSGPMPPNGLPAPAGTQLPSNFVQGLNDIKNQYLKAKPMSAPDSELLHTIDMATAHANNGGTLSGKQFQNYLRDYAAGSNRARQSSIVNGQMTGAPDHEAAQAYSQLSDLLENQATTAIPEWQQNLFRATNAKWRNMKTLESLAPTDINADFNPASIARKLNRQNGVAPSGNTTLQDLARFGDSYMGFDANTSKRGLWQQGKHLVKTASPFIATGLGEGAIIAAGVHDGPDENDGTLTKIAKASALPLAAMAAIAAGRGSLNKPVSLDSLNQPRGALADWARIMQPAPAVAALLAARQPPRFELDGMANGKDD
jgi:hypothetical protein